MSFGIDVNYNEAGAGSDLLPEGEYEAIIKYVGEDVTPASGSKVYISVVLIIRNDVDQKYKNKFIWYPLWKRKEPSPADAAVGGYSIKQIQTLSKSAGLPNGKKYPDIQEWYDDLKNKVIRVTIKHELFNGEQQAKVNYVNPSKFPECTHTFKSADSVAATSATSTSDNEDFTEIGTDDDMPF
jgi:hypothetical protein